MRNVASSRTRLGVGLAAAAVAVFVAGAALRATLTAARVSSEYRQAERVPNGTGMAALHHRGIHGRGSSWPVPNSSPGESRVARRLTQVPTLEAQERRPPNLHSEPEFSGPRPSDVVPLLDQADAWNAVVLRPGLPLWPAPSGTAGATPAPAISTSSPVANSSSSDGRKSAASVLLFVEYNATDGDAGVQVSFDGPGWTRVRVVGPTGRTIVETTDPLGVSVLDLTELVPEGEEPTLAQLLQMFPPGEYSFRGTGVGGTRLESAGTLSYEIPDPAVIVAVDPSVPVITWTWRPGPRSPIRELAGFQVILESAREVAVTFDLTPSTRSLVVPAEFLEPGVAYRVDLLAIAANGNRTVTETAFVTRRRP
jgi:hypothetical protein